MVTHVSKSLPPLKTSTSFGENPKAMLGGLDVGLPIDLTKTKIEYDEDGSVVVDFGTEDQEFNNKIYQEGHYENLVDLFSEEELSAIANEVIDATESDNTSRGQWLDTIELGLDALGLKVEEDSGLFPGSCAAHHPLIMESAVKFQSKASNELLPANGPCKTEIIGEKSIPKEQQANRVKDFFNYDLMEVMEEYTSEMERLLLVISVYGSAFTKTYYDASLERKVTEFVSADVVVVPYHATDLRRANRFTHIIYKDKINMLYDMDSGLYKSYDLDGEKGEWESLGKPSPPQLSQVQLKYNEIIGIAQNVSATDEVYTLYEQHVYKVLKNVPEQKKLPLPYVITVDYNSRKVLSIRRNWKEDDKKKRRRDCFVHWSFVPGFGFYGLGYLHLLGNFQITLTAILRSLVDSGQFANMQGGFKAKGLKIIGDNEAIAPGEFKEVEAPNMDLSKAIYPLQYKEPSTVLFQMLQFMEARGQKFADSTEQVIADSTNYGPVGTTMALLEASTKFFSAIFKRLHKAQKLNFKIMKELNYECLPDTYPYDVAGASRTVFKDDFDGSVEVIPVSDPNISSQAHRTTMAQTQLQIAQMFPDKHDIRETLFSIYTNMNFDNIEKILPAPEEAQMLDPLSDIMAASSGKPIKAFEGQNHDAHINVKMSFLQDPTLGQNPALQRIIPVLQNNITEHTMLKYKEMMTAQMQQGQADPMQETAQVEAAQKLQQLNELATKVQAAGGMEDPAMLVAKAELMKAQNEANRIKAKEDTDNAKLNLEAAQLDLDKIKEANANSKFKDTLIAGINKEHMKHQVAATKSSLDRLGKD